MWLPLGFTPSPRHIVTKCSDPDLSPTRWENSGA